MARAGNGYAYVEGDPVNSVDPSGHSIAGTIIRRLFARLSTHPKVIKSVPKALLQNTKGGAVRLRKITPNTAKRLEKRSIAKGLDRDAAKRQLEQQTRRLDKAKAVQRNTRKVVPSRIENDYEQAKNLYDQYEKLYNEARADFVYANRKIGKRAITKEARANLKLQEKEIDFNQASTAQQQRIALGNRLAKPIDIRLPEGERHYLGSNPDY